jgi:predicted metalloprotease
MLTTIMVGAAAAATLLVGGVGEAGAPVVSRYVATAASSPGAAMNQDVQDAAQVVNGYWAAHWTQYFTGSYRPPQLYGLYDASTAPSCAGQPEDPDNAAYCPDGDFLAFGSTLLSRGYAGGTNSWTYLIVAHEWGHAVQARLSDELRSQAAELQADCFAGAVLCGAARDGTLAFGEGDEKGMVDSLNQEADETPWTKADDHGSTLQRIDAFSRGRSGGVAACLPS